jgi:hypothetical protein
LKKPHGIEVPAWKFILIGHLFDRPWFGRAWVVQEAFYAQKAVVQSGDKTLPWPTLLTVNKCLETARRRAGAMGHRTMPNIISSLMEVEDIGEELTVEKRVQIDALEIVLRGIDL